MIAGLENITSGELWFGSTNAAQLSIRDRGVAMVFQTGALYPHRTVRDNISYPLRMAREDPATANTKAAGLAAILGIDKVLDRLPRSLSGGERQRVAIGRAIIREPKVFLMDEPLSNLDATVRTELRQEIGSMTRNLGATTVYVTHDQVEALTLADRIAIMRDGQIEDVGTPGQIYEDPATAFVAGFLGSPRINLMTATVQVAAHRRIVLDFGKQSISLPRADRRALALQSKNGMRVIVGARTDAFTLTADSGHANQLSGRLRTLEFHGHQWVAFIESDIGIANPDLIGLDTDRQATSAKSLARPISRRSGRHRHLGGQEHGPPVNGFRRPTLAALARAVLQPSRPAAAEHVAAPLHRRSELILEVEPFSNLKAGDPIHLTVDVSRILIFDRAGRRVDRVVRHPAGSAANPQKELS
jgi:multiple sugar transport system ATP-binding protein